MASAVDNLRDRWDRITPRERRLVLALAGSAVLLILWWVASTISGGLDQLETKNDKTRKVLSSLHDFRVRRALGAVPDKPQVKVGETPVELESYLEKIAKEVGITIPSYNPRPESTKGRFTEVATRFDVRGLTIQELKDLLQAIESGQGGRVIVSDLQIKRQFREQEKLDVDLVVSTFYSAAEKIEGEGGGAKKGEEG
jgi:type II secretory pathway component PulM